MATGVERSAGAGGAPEHAPMQVVQPQKLDLSSVAEVLADIGNVAEAAGEDRSGDWSGSAGGRPGMTVAGDHAVSPRDRAIAAAPAPTVMLRKLERHVVTEIKTLRRDIRRVTRIRAPGSAHHLNELYTRLRRLNALLRSLVEASVEVVKRLFVKVFIDKQPIL